MKGQEILSIKKTFKSPEAVREPKFANKCDECSFMTPSKESCYKFIKHHREGFKCEHCEETCIFKSILKEHIFSVHMNKKNCSFFIKGKCTRSCEFQPTAAMNLIVLMLRVANAYISIKCTQCENKFSGDVALFRNMKQKHYDI